jgi:hypothetical protein
MRFEARRLVLVIAAVVVVSFAAGVGYAQRLFGVEPVTPMILSGPDVGFRMEGQRGATPVGKLVVRIDGQWVEADFGGGVRVLPAK